MHVHEANQLNWSIFAGLRIVNTANDKDSPNWSLGVGPILLEVAVSHVDLIYFFPFWIDLVDIGSEGHHGIWVLIDWLF